VEERYLRKKQQQKEKRQKAKKKNKMKRRFLTTASTWQRYVTILARVQVTFKEREQGMRANHLNQ
jgi:hypothetical protein